MEKQLLLNTINATPEYAKNALDHVYRGNVYVVASVSEYSVRTDGFFKTKRGAECHLKRSQSFTYYSEAINDMVTAGAGYEIYEIAASEIVDPLTSKQVWFDFVRKEILGHTHMYQWVLNVAKYMQVSEEVMEYVTEMVEEMKEHNCLTTPAWVAETAEEIEETDVQEVIESEVNETAIMNNKEIAPVSYSLNEEQSGIEIRFESKPEQSFIESLKANGFRWSKRGFWYAKQSAERLSFTQSLVGDADSSLSSVIEFEYPEIQIDDIETYVVDKNLQQAEHASNWIFRKQEIDRTKEIQEVFQSYNDKVKSVLATTDNKRLVYHLKKALQRYKKQYFEVYVSRLRHGASNPNWAVTGRGGLNTKRYNQKMNKYDHLMGKSVELMKEMDSTIEKAQREIRQDKEAQIKVKMEQTNMTIEFKTESRTITLHGLTENVRAYLHGEFMIAKTWGCYRIFKNGKEIHSMKSKDKLDDAKRYVAMLVSEEVVA